MKNIIKLKSYTEEGDPNAKAVDVYFNVAGYVTIKSTIETYGGIGSAFTILFQPSHSNSNGVYALELMPGKNLVTQDMVNEVEAAIVENSLTPLAIADIQSIIEPISEYTPVEIRQDNLPELTA